MRRGPRPARTSRPTPATSPLTPCWSNSKARRGRNNGSLRRASERLHQSLLQMLQRAALRVGGDGLRLRLLRLPRFLGLSHLTLGHLRISFESISLSYSAPTVP